MLGGAQKGAGLAASNQEPPLPPLCREGSVATMAAVSAFCFLEALILGSVFALWYLLEFSEPFPGALPGFFCRDPSFARPYPGPPAASRAPPALVYGLVTAVPALTMVLGELLGPLGRCRGGPTPPSLWGRSCGAPLRRLLRYLEVFSFGLLATAIFALAGQVTTGAPAPHFLSVCRPNYSALGCSAAPPPPPAAAALGCSAPPAPPAAPPRFVPAGAALCAGEPPLVAAARRTFPCKEAALGAYAGAYAGLYVTLAWRGAGSRLAKPAAALCFAAPPFLLGALRVAEHRNHWGDVAAGLVCGAGIAAFLVLCVVGSFQSPGEGGGAPRAPPELPPPQQRPLEEISVTQGHHLDFPAVT
ncbi:phospholipid phosphatase-related protein type 2-like [Guaruba guarouba]